MKKLIPFLVAAISVCTGQTGSGTTPPAFTMEQSISDGAQRATLAFAGLAMMTGNLPAQSFFPPGKVADYTGFQYLRDNDPDNMGHNTSFLTRVANNVLYILSDSQLAQLKTLALAQQDQITLYGYKRFALMKAFRRLLDGDVPAGATGLDLLAVKQASKELYRIDGQISFDRALLYASIFSSMNFTQTAYLDAMKGKGFNSWPDISNDLVREKTKGLSQGEAVAVMTYAGDLFSWYAGSLDADVYFCPERHGTYFGSFYIKDAPAIGHEGYSIDEQLTATAGAALCDSSKGYVTAGQASAMSSLVSAQRNNLYAGTTSIVSIRTQIASLLRGLMVSTASSASVNAQVLALSEIYGGLDGENNFNYATVFASVYSTLTDAQLAGLAALRKSIMSGTYSDGTAFDFSVCTTPFLYSAAITDQSVLAPYIADTGYLFSSALGSAAPWRQQYFGTAENAGSAADSSDPDGDGLTNAREYALGTDPTTSDTGGLLGLAPAANNLSLTFFGRQAAGAGYVGFTRHYCVEGTGNLADPASWTPVIGFADIVGSDRAVTLKQPITGTKYFFRLRVWLQ
ncbi:MAG: thrombospondin type 3 repeat-containing protein [Verrucomicrobia bacterium]|nr:thrombospondin type 3 repeat-containing protein [Verrucomicrobiota bacterium]